MKIYGRWEELVDIIFRRNGKKVTVSPNNTTTYSADRTVELPQVDGNEQLVGRISADQGTGRLRNKDFEDASTKFVDDADVTKTFSLSLGGSAANADSLLVFSNSADRTYTFPDATTTLVGTDVAQTLTNKTIAAGSNTISGLLHGTQVDNPSSGVHGVSGAVVGTSDNQLLSNKQLDDGSVVYQNTAVTTKKFRFDVSGVTAGATRVYTVPDANTTLVGTDTSQVLTNKTLDADLNTISDLANANIKAAAAIALDKLAATTASRALASDASGFITASSVTSTELGHLSGVTSGIQTQLNAKQANVITTQGDLVRGNVSGSPERLAIGASGTVLTSNGTQVSWATPAGTGDVTAASNIADNAVVRGDGGAKGVQQSGVTLNDSDQFSSLVSTGQLSQPLSTAGSYTIASGFGQISSNYTVNTGHTVTIASSARWDILDVLTTDGTVSVVGTLRVGALV